MGSTIAFITIIMAFQFSDVHKVTAPETNQGPETIAHSTTERAKSESNNDTEGPESASNANPDSSPSVAASATEATLIDFSETSPSVWQIVNDNVMGGVSTSRVDAHEEGFAIFSGTVSLRNNGGFASMRAQAQQPADLSGYEGLSVRVLGDGKVYSLRLKTVVNGRITWYAFEANFPTVAGEWQTYYLPFNEFRPVYRGSSVRGNPQLNADAVIELGFMIKERQEGPFSLGIQTVSVYRN